VKFLLDENVERVLFLGLKWRHPGLDVVRVVDVGLGGKPDLEVLEWAAREGRVVVSRDRATLSAEAARRVSEGHPMPGLILLRQGAGWGSPPSPFRKKGEANSRNSRNSRGCRSRRRFLLRRLRGYCGYWRRGGGTIAAIGSAVLEGLCGVCGVCGYCSAAPSESQEPV